MTTVRPLAEKDIASPGQNSFILSQENLGLNLALLSLLPRLLYLIISLYLESTESEKTIWFSLYLSQKGFIRPVIFCPRFPFSKIREHKTPTLRLPLFYCSNVASLLSPTNIYLKRYIMCIYGLSISEFVLLIISVNLK